MTTLSLSDRYPRSMKAWLKTDEKALAKALASGQSLLELAEDLQREHVTLLHHLRDLALLEFEEHTEEWVEVMCLALDGVPLHDVIAWVTAAEVRPTHQTIHAIATDALRADFELARRHKIFIVNSDALTDLHWLSEQPAAVVHRYEAACAELSEAFDVITPTTLKNRILGIAVESPARISPAPACTSKTSWRDRSAKGGAATTTRVRRKTYRAKRSNKGWSRKARSSGRRSPSYA